MATSLPPSPMAAVTGASGEFFIIRTAGTGNIVISQTPELRIRMKLTRSDPPTKPNLDLIKTT